MKVWVEEEFGYQHWLWTFPGNAEELVADWKAGKAPLNFFDPSKGNYRGEMKIIEDRAELDQVRKSAEAFIHTHEIDDTYLIIGDPQAESSPVYQHPKWNGKKVSCPKCKTENTIKNAQIRHSKTCWKCGTGLAELFDGD